MRRFGTTGLCAVVAFLALVPAGSAAPRRPDLTVTAVGASRTIAVQGGSLVVDAGVRNRGTASAPASTLAVLISSTTAATSGPPIGGTAATARLRPGRRALVDVEAVIPAALAPGTYRLIACADRLRRVRERREANNCRATATPLIVRAAADFGPSPGSPAPSAPTDPAAPTGPAGPGGTGVTVPSRPTLTGTTPSSPSSDETPLLHGSAGAGTTVEVYDAAACTGIPLATGSAATLAGPGIEVPVPENRGTQLRATATDASGNESACAVGPVYVEDSTAPTTPALSGTTPGSPSNDETPAVQGSAEAGSTVRLFSTSDCTGSPLASGSAAALAGPGIEVTVPEDATSAVRATATDPAGNTSGCSSPLSYEEDSTPPPAAMPNVDFGTFQSSPANVDEFTVQVITELEGESVSVYTGADCSGTPVDSGPSSPNPPFGSAFVGSVPVAPNSTTDIRVTRTDAAGNVSGCSDPLTVVEDSIAPNRPVIAASVPVSPSSDPQPFIKGTAEGGSTVRVFLSANCQSFVSAGGSAAAFADTGFQVTVAEEATTQITARATDAAGNQSECSSPPFSYRHDVPPPAPQDLTFTPVSGSADQTPDLSGTATGNLVEIYANGACSGTPEATVTPAQFASGHTITTVPANTSVSYSATATDGGGTSGCSSPATYEHDSTPDFLEEDFSDNSAGWTLVGNQWQIGPAAVSSGHASGNPDPGEDTTPTADNGVAGTIIGGNRSLLAGLNALESPAMDTSSATTLTLRFQRWLNADDDIRERSRVEVFDGVEWQVVERFNRPPGDPQTRDDSWQPMTYDVTAHKNASFRVRFTNEILQGSAFVMSGWNIDDVVVEGG